jgi:hypothetical protein
MRRGMRATRRTVMPLRSGLRGWRYSFCVGAAVASEYRLQPEANKGLQAREALFPLEKGSWERG